MHLFRNRIHEHFNINFFKDEESDKMSADSALVQGTSGGESTDSPALSGPYSLNIDARVCIYFSNIITILKYCMIDVYHLVINIMRISPN